jgi:serine protease
MVIKPHVSTQRAATGGRMLKRAALGAAAAVLVLSAGAGAAQAQVAAPGPAHHAHSAGPAGLRVVNLHRQYLAQLRHVKVGKLAGIVRPRGWHGATAAKVKATCSEPNCNLVYNGGPVQHNPQVYMLFWGPNWNTDPSQLATSNYMAGLYEGLGVAPQDTWSAITSQYGDGSGFPQFTGTELRFPIIDDPSTPPTGVTPTELAAEANAAASFWVSNGFPIGPNDQIVIATQSGTCPAGFAAPGCPPPGASPYCAWHSAFSSSSFTNQPFINMPYILDAGGSCGENFINPGTAGLRDGVSMVGGHEYAETITDPVPDSGWMDTADAVSGGEIGDKCAWGGILWGSSDPAGNVTLSTGTFAMQSLWSNAAGGCVMAATEDTVSVTSPGNRDTGTGGTVDLQMSGSSSGSNPLEWTATGLPAGLSISSSGLITGTATTAGTYHTAVYAGDDTGATGSASFTWTVAADTVTVNSPGNQTSYANAQVSLQISGASSAGFNPLLFSSADLPADLLVNSAGLITGHVPHASTYPVTVTGTDAGGISGSTSFNWTIKPDVGKPVKESSAGVCLNDSGSVTTVGNPVTVAKCNGGGAQKWTFPSTGTGKLTVFGMCLGDPASGGAGTKLALATCSSASSDNWTHQSNGEYVLKLNGLCLTDPSNSTKNGTKVTITTCTAATSQVWTLP